MSEQPTIQSPESDLARGLAEFRQGRKTLLPEFELPTDDMPKEAEVEVSIERLTVYNLEQILKETNAEERLYDLDFIHLLVEDINDSLEEGRYSPSKASEACWTISAIYSLGIKHPELTPEKLDPRRNDPDFLKQLTENIVDDYLEQGKTDPDNAYWACSTISAIYSLGIKHPELTPEKLGSRLNDPEFLEQLIEGLDEAFDLGKTYPNYASQICEIISAIYSLGIKHPELTPEKLEIHLNDPEFLKQLTKYINNSLKRGKKDSGHAVGVCETLSAIQNIIGHYSAIADEKEKAEVAHKFKTAADRIGVPPRPEVKAF